MPNYVYDLWMPLLGIEAIGVYAVYLRLMRDSVVKGIAQSDIARACRVGNRRLAIINQTLEQCGFITISKPTRADRVRHFTTEITVREAPRQISPAAMSAFYTNEKNAYQPLTTWLLEGDEGGENQMSDDTQVNVIWHVEEMPNDISVNAKWHVEEMPNDTPVVATSIVATPESLQPLSLQSSSRACAHEGAPEAPGETTTTTHAPVNMQEMLHENGKGQDAEKAPAPSGDTPAAPPTPPPSSAPPPSPGALADDALWRAYVAGGGIDAVPVSAFGPYADAWLRLVRAGATPGEVERMTRDRLRGRAPDRPYRFVFLPDDLAEWRRGRRRPVDVMRDDGNRYIAGEFAAFFANNRNQTAQPALGG